MAETTYLILIRNEVYENIEANRNGKYSEIN